MSKVQKALRVASKRRKYARGGDVDDLDPSNKGQVPKPLQYSMKDIPETWTRVPPQRYAEGGNVLDWSGVGGALPEDIGKDRPVRDLAANAAVGAATLYPRYVKATVDAARTQPGSEEARQAYGDVGAATGELGMSMIGPKTAKAAGNNLGVFVGPYGAHMLRDADRKVQTEMAPAVRLLGGNMEPKHQPHPVYGEETAQAAAGLRPEFRDAYKGWQVDARDAGARGMLEMRAASGRHGDRDIFADTGWSRGAEGLPRKEIPDLGAKLVPLKGTDKFVLEHPAGDFHKIYDIPPFSFTNKLKPGSAVIHHDTGSIVLGGNPANKKDVQQATSAALHEVQHAIQKHEGFVNGTNPNDAMKRKEMDSEVFFSPARVSHSGFTPATNEIPSWHAKMADFQRSRRVDPSSEQATIMRGRHVVYERSAGETEARNVQARRAKGFRYGLHPEDTEDIGRGLQWEDKIFVARPRKDIKIYDPAEGIAEAKKRGVDISEIDPPSGFTHVLRRASGGGVGNFNPERAAAFGLAKQGMINSDVPGRTDKLNLKVPTGSYVIPADIPSAIGEGNTKAGGSILDKMFTKGPYGMNLPKTKRLGSGRGSSLTKKMRFADGGATPDAMDIVAAGGEYLVHPEAIAHLGGGNMDTGHAILDAFVKHVRDNHIQTLRNLKPPKGSE